MSNFVINPYRFVSAGASICNDAVVPSWTSTISTTSIYMRCTPIDVSSLSNPFTPTHLGYTAGASMDGSLALGLYTDDSGAGLPDSLICQTDTHAVASTNYPDPLYLETLTNPSTSHSGKLWIGVIFSGVTLATSNFKGYQPIDEPYDSFYMNYDPVNYPDCPATFVEQGGTGTNYFFCLTAS